MPEFRTTRRVAHSAEEMFDLVADVERYPEFVPFCERLTVRGRRKEGEREVLVADMTVGYKLIRETFTSKVTLDRPALQIRADYLDGPFRSHGEPLDLSSRSPDGGSRDQLLHRLRVPQPHAGAADGRDVRPRLPHLRATPSRRAPSRFTEAPVAA